MVTVGYINTEIGTIPSDWMVKTFGEISKVNQGLQIAISERKKITE
jgi:type I restriction enzyme, S subunit